MRLRFDGRVAIVTGAGGGLGRSYALLLASRGAKVVVNDLGGSKSGEGGSSRAADLVVQEIRSAGGEAVANYSSVEEGAAVVETAIKEYGRVDILINNAGILRDKSLTKLGDQDWDLVHRVHLRGAFKVTQAAWPHMKNNNFGRIIMTSSIAGIFGNFGQANYSAAKLGLVGLSNTLAAEGARFGIKSNVIVPMAASRLTQDILPPDVFEALAPEHIAPIVAWLCHEDCTDSGSIIEAAGGWAGRYRWQRSHGKVLTNPSNGQVSIEDVEAGWSDVTDMSNAEYPDSTQQATMDIVSRIQQSLSNTQSNQQEPTALSAVGYVSQPFHFEYTFKELILYALGVGVSTKDENGLKYLYENHEEFAALPTFGVIPAMSGLDELVTGKIPGLDIPLANVLHGEQYMQILRPLPASGRLANTLKILDVLDKGSGMVILVEIETLDSNGDTIMRNQSTIFVRDSGGFKGPRDSKHAIAVAKIPQRSPDKTLSFRTTADQAALYRLSGDLNPLHIDPNFSAIGGYETPILHGLCTYGIAVRHVVDGFCGGEPNAVKEVKARFSKPVIPGQTVVTDMWKEGDRVLFTCSVKETGERCLTGGWVRIMSSNSKL